MGREVREIRNLAGMSNDTFDTLRRSLRAIRTLGDVVEWSRSREPALTIDEVITQDEYTHDVLIHIEGPLWLAFDVT